MEGKLEDNISQQLHACKVTSDVSDSLQPCGLSGSSVHGILQARILECVACPPPGDLPDPGIEPAFLSSFFFFFEPAFPMSPALQALPLAPPGKPSPSISEVYFLIVSGGHLVRDHLLPSLPYLKFTHSPPSTKNQQLLCARHREKGREGKAQASGNSECVYGYLEHSQVNLVPHTVLIMVRT